MRRRSQALQPTLGWQPWVTLPGVWFATHRYTTRGLPVGLSLHPQPPPSTFTQQGASIALQALQLSSTANAALIGQDSPPIGRQWVTATMLRCYDATMLRVPELWVTVFNFDVKMVTLCCTVWTGAPHFNGVKKLTNIEKINIEKWVRQKYLHLHLGNLADAFIQSDLQKIHLSEEREKTIYCCRYSKDKCQALTIVRLTHSPYTIKITRTLHNVKYYF